jgi:hypothetical protein
VPARPVKPAAGPFRVLTYNTYFQNFNYHAQASLILKKINPEIINIQESINDMMPSLVRTLNSQATEGTWKQANPWSHHWYWCGLTAYRSDLWDLEWHKEVAVRQHGDSRGVCGARLRRKADGFKMCVWGTHPIWRDHGNSWWARDAIMQAAWAMKECAEGGAGSALFGDFNTNDVNTVNNQLQASTGWSWQNAVKDGYDQVYIQTGPTRVGRPFDGHGVCSHCGRRGCGKHGCQNPNWGYADHPPTYVSIDPAA